MGCRYVVIEGNVVTKYGCPKSSLTGGQNIAEYQRWQEVKDTPNARYFVPVLDYAEDGSWLTMPRVKVLSPTEKVRLQAFMAVLASHGIKELDDQTDNTGEYEGRTVLLDYGFEGYDRNILGSSLACTKCIVCKNAGRVEVR